MTAFTAWKRMMGYLRNYWLWAFIALVGIIGSNILAIIIPIVLRDVIDIGLALNASSFMILAGLLVVALGLLRGITGFLFRYFGERLSHHIAYDIRNQVYDRVQTLQFSYHDKAEVGALITRAISDVDEMQRYFAYGLIDGLNTALLCIGVVTIMVLTSPVLALITLIPLIPLAYSSRNFALKVGPMWNGIMERISKLSNQLQESVIGAQVVRAFAREDYEVQKFAEQNEILYREQVDLVRRWATYLPLSAFIITFSTGLVLFVGGLMEQTALGAPLFLPGSGVTSAWFNDTASLQGFSGVTVGLVVAFNAYVLLLNQPLRFLGFVILLFTQAITSSKRVFEILDAPITISSKPDAVKHEPIEGLVKFNAVTFAYEADRPPVLKQITIEAKPNQVVALVGPTGSGKSTLISLIPRFYDVTEGSVTIDGIDVRDYDLHTLRRQIGTVLQNPILFSATIAENIAYGRPDAPQEAIEAAAKAANAHDFIMEFPEGYETRIGERGVTLSGGQRQRIAIARALLIDPRILILDDSTSSVDTRTEHLIQQALSRLMQGRTTFVIAQRLSTVQRADQILVLKDGEIIERGTHDELLRLNGLYTQIYNLQMADQERVKGKRAKAPELVIAKEDRHSTQEFQRIIEEAGTD